MGGDLAGMLKLAAVGEIGGDAGGAEGMAGEGRGEAGLDGAPLDHGEHFPWLQAGDRSADAGCRRCGRGGLLVLAGEAGRVDIGVDKLLGLMMRRHLMMLAALFMEAELGALADLIIVLDIHTADRAD
jgi:hypothetical protein